MSPSCRDIICIRITYTDNYSVIGDNLGFFVIDTAVKLK
jgi:hypothetical protein